MVLDSFDAAAAGGAAPLARLMEELCAVDEAGDPPAAGAALTQLLARTWPHLRAALLLAAGPGPGAGPPRHRRRGPAVAGFVKPVPLVLDPRVGRRCHPA